MKGLILAAVAIATLGSGCAASYHVTPIESPPATVRYDHGAPTTSLEQRHGGVQVTPMQFDSDGRLVFGVAAFNSGDRSANFGTENIETRSPDNHSLRIYTVEDLVRQARNKAIAASVAIALLGAASAAASQAAAHQSYNSTLYTPHGTYHYKASYYDAGQAAAGTAASIAGASAGIYAVNQSLEGAIAGIGESVLQTTTVDPGESVAGRVLVQRPRGSKDPQEITMLVHWNGEDYPFRFQITRSDRRGSQSSRPVDADTSSPPVSQEVANIAPASLATAELQAAPQQPPSLPAVSAAPPTSPPASSRAASRQLPAPTPGSFSASTTLAGTVRSAPQHAAVPASAEPTRNDAADDDDAYNERMWKEQAKFTH